MVEAYHNCRKCKCELNDDNNSYEDEICDDCFEKEVDEQLAEKDE